MSLLIRRKATERLGHNNIWDIIEHNWLKNVKWSCIKAKRMKAPYVPKKGDNSDKKYCLFDKRIDLLMRYQSYLHDE